MIAKDAPRDGLSVHHEGRGLCRTCRPILVDRLDMIDEYPRINKPRRDVIEDFVFLTDTMRVTREKGALLGVAKSSRRVIAERMGMKLATLDRALQRAARPTP